MSDKELATNLQSNALIGFEIVLLELKSILETYLDKLNEDGHPDPTETAETVRLLARTMEYKHEQILKLATEVNAYWTIVTNRPKTKVETK